MKVTTQGEEVVNLLWDVIAAKGFEKDMIFETVAQDIRALPKLEGTVHVNMALIIKFMRNYFFDAVDFGEVEKRTDQTDDFFLFRQGPTSKKMILIFCSFLANFSRWLPMGSSLLKMLGSKKSRTNSLIRFLILWSEISLSSRFSSFRKRVVPGCRDFFPARC
jgi:hypothetical protein